MQWYKEYLQHFNSNSVIRWTLFILFMSHCYWLASSEEGKIIGGRDAKNGEFPSTLCFRGAVRCGGTLVTLDKFLTAGSCFDLNENVSYIAMFGGVADFRDKGRQEIYVLSFKRHKSWENRTTADGYYILNDISIGVLESAYVKTDGLSPAVFAASDEKGMKAFVDNFRDTKQVCLGTGYGAVDIDSPVDSVSFMLKVIEIVLLPDKDCNIISEMHDKEACGTAVKQNEHMFVGDKGSTLTCGGQVVGMTKGFKKVEKDGKTIYVTIFVMFGPYLEGFKLGKGKGTKLFHFHPVILLSFLVSRLYQP